MSLTPHAYIPFFAFYYFRYILTSYVPEWFLSTIANSSSDRWSRPMIEEGQNVLQYLYYTATPP